MTGLAEALAADFKAAQKSRGLSAEQVCIAYDKKPTSTWAYQLCQGKVPFTLAMVPMWTDLTGAEHFMRWMGGITEHVVAPVPTANNRTNVAESIQRFADFLKSTAKADQDGKTTETECKEIESRSRRAMSQILGVVHYYREHAKASRDGRVSKLRDAS